MEQGRNNKKRPCRICRKWFRADPRVGERQMTCGNKDCQNKWHTRKCSEWNRNNPTYFREIYLSRKLTALNEAGGSNDPPESSRILGVISKPKSSKSPKLLINPVQEVMAAQQIVIIEYIVRLLLKSFQEEISPQLPKKTIRKSQLPPQSVLRADSSRSSP